MQQLEIEFFWSLTEQIPLDLDFTPCIEYEKKKREELAKNNVTTHFNGSLYLANGGTGVSTVSMTPTFTSLHIRTEPETVGYWEMGSAKLQVHREVRPNWFNRVMTKLFFGWKWKDSK